MALHFPHSVTGDPNPFLAFSMGVAILTFFYGIFIFPVLALAGTLPYLSSAVRRNRALRVVCALPLVPIPLLLLNLGAWILYLPAMSSLEYKARTSTLTAPETRYGITLPARTVVQTLERDDPGFLAHLPAPILADGLLVSGDLTLDARPGNRTLDGTLASPQTLQTIPCAPGPFVLSHDALSCLLSRDTALSGLPAAAGHQVILNSPDPSQPITLSELTLAAPWPASPLPASPLPASPLPAAPTDRPWLTSSWPAGSVLTVGFTHPNVLEVSMLCVPPGAEATFAHTRFHGPVSVRFQGNTVAVSNNCDSEDTISENQYGSLHTPDGLTHRQGTFTLATSTWAWTDENIPPDHVDRTVKPEE